MAWDSSTMPASTESTAPAAPDLPAAGLWRLRLLGLPCLVSARSPTTVRLSPKDAALLAVVALDGPMAAEHVAALIWPAVDRKKADTNLRQRLFKMRRDFGTNLITSDVPLRLAPEVLTDVPATLAQIASDEDAGRAELLGDLDFEDLPDLADWVRTARSRWHAQRDAALAAATAQCEAGGHIARGLAYAQRLIESDPLSEHAQRRLMRLHYLRGDRGGHVAYAHVEADYRERAEPTDVLAAVAQVRDAALI